MQERYSSHDTCKLVFFSELNCLKPVGDRLLERMERPHRLEDFMSNDVSIVRKFDEPARTKRVNLVGGSDGALSPPGLPEVPVAVQAGERSTPRGSGGDRSGANVGPSGRLCGTGTALYGVAEPTTVVVDLARVAAAAAAALGKTRTYK